MENVAKKVQKTYVAPEIEVIELYGEAVMENLFLTISDVKLEQPEEEEVTD